MSERNANRISNSYVYATGTDRWACYNNALLTYNQQYICYSIN